MLVYPCAKINLGLNVISKRNDGYHNLETVFYPVPLCDMLEVHPIAGASASLSPCDLKVMGGNVDCATADNLVARAYGLLAAHHDLPPVQALLTKRIPSQAGLGGGSADAAFMIRLLNELFHLDISRPDMERHAARLGSDCAFFIAAQPSFATGRGEILEPLDDLCANLKGHYIGIVKPDVAVSTREAFAGIACRQPCKCCRDIVRQPVSTWKAELSNDFERTVFRVHPQLATVKRKMYELGAVYAQMSGSGSALFGIFESEPSELAACFPGCFTFQGQL